MIDPDDTLAVLLGRPAWQADAACHEHPEVSWFPEQGEPTEPAKRICSTCLVRSTCLAFAIDEHIDAGVWGGTSTRERRRLRAPADPA